MSRCSARRGEACQRGQWLRSVLSRQWHLSVRQGQLHPEGLQVRLLRWPQPDQWPPWLRSRQQGPELLPGLAVPLHLPRPLRPPDRLGLGRRCRPLRQRGRSPQQNRQPQLRPLVQRRPCLLSALAPPEGRQAPRPEPTWSGHQKPSERPPGRTRRERGGERQRADAARRCDSVRLHLDRVRIGRDDIRDAHRRLRCQTARQDCFCGLGGL